MPGTRMRAEGGVKARWSCVACGKFGPWLPTSEEAMWRQVKAGLAAHREKCKAKAKQTEDAA